MSKQDWMARCERAEYEADELRAENARLKAELSTAIEVITGLELALDIIEQAQKGKEE